MKPLNARNKRSQRGIAAVEFALVASLLVTLLIGIAELSRLTFYWNTATELTRLGARLAVVCGIDDTIIKTRMRAMLPTVTEGEIDIEYLPAGCDSANCTQVRVSIASITQIRTFIPFVPTSVHLAPFSTTLPRESMNSVGNPVCE